MLPEQDFHYMIQDTRIVRIEGDPVPPLGHHRHSRTDWGEASPTVGHEACGESDETLPQVNRSPLQEGHRKSRRIGRDLASLLSRYRGITGLSLPDLSGRELKIRAHVDDLDLDGVTLVTGVVLPRALDELAGDEDPHPLLEGAARVLRYRARCRAAEEPVGDVLPLGVVLGAVADRDGEACEGLNALGVAELGIVGDVSD